MGYISAGRWAFQRKSICSLKGGYDASSRRFGGITQCNNDSIQGSRAVVTSLIASKTHVYYDGVYERRKWKSVYLR